MHATVVAATMAEGGKSIQAIYLLCIFATLADPKIRKPDVKDIRGIGCGVGRVLLCGSGARAYNAPECCAVCRWVASAAPGSVLIYVLETTIKYVAMSIVCFGRFRFKSLIMRGSKLHAPPHISPASKQASNIPNSPSLIPSQLPSLAACFSSAELR